MNKATLCLPLLVAACSSGPPDDPAGHTEWLLAEVEDVVQDNIVSWGRQALQRNYDYRDPALDPLYLGLRKLLQPRVAMELWVDWESERTKAALWELSARIAPAALPFQDRHYFAETRWTSEELPPQRAQVDVVFELRGSEARYQLDLRRSVRGGWEVIDAPRPVRRAKATSLR